MMKCKIFSFKVQKRQDRKRFGERVCDLKLSRDMNKL